MPDDNGRSGRGAAPGQWDRYWEHGFLTSCADAYTANYEGEIAAAWRGFFAELRPGARLLDVCTGNGAIAAMAAEHSLDHDAGFSIDGIDLARIHPETALRDRPDIAAQISFHPATSADMTPFDARTFDAIVGQYALEYTPLDSTVAELARIAAPGCRVMFVMHHPDSIVLSTTREELTHARLLFDESKLFERARAFIEYVAAAAPAGDRSALAHDSRAESLRNALNDAAAAVTDRVRRSAHPELLTNALGCVGEAYKQLEHWGVGGALAHLEKGRRELKLNVERLEDLRRAALPDDDRARLGTLLRGAGFFTPRFDTLHHEDGAILGWRMQTVRRA